MGSEKGELMSRVNIVLGICNISCGIVFIAIGIPLLKRKIKMNGLYGFRLAKAYESEENWYDINAYGARQLIIWSIPVILTGIISLFVPIDDRSAMPALVGAGPVTISVLIAMVRTLTYAKKL
jgi:hypothetical protein